MSAAIGNLKFLRCTVKAQERIEGTIHPARSLMKLTYNPLRIYIKNQKGVEVLWLAGQNGGDAWVYPAAFPYVTLSLDPNGKLMRGNLHHTALQAGFGTITDLLRSTACARTIPTAARFATPATPRCKATPTMCCGPIFRNFAT